MKIDGDALSKACSSETTCNVNHNLCGSELNVVLDQLKETQISNKNLLIACTQEQKTFDQIAEENNFETPKTFNIREYAGWSKESEKSIPKISSLIHSSLQKNKQTPSLTLESSGRCFVYVDSNKGEKSIEVAFDLCKKLTSHLGVTLMISNIKDDLILEPNDFKITKGYIKKAQGYFTQFKLEINDFAESLPSSKSTINFGDFYSKVDTDCDLIIDLSENTPMFTGDHKRDGYFRASTNSPSDLFDIYTKVIDMIGQFEKPIYVDFNESLCAHSRNGITGCTKCLDVCPAGAIQSIGDIVSVDPGICGGCGFCGSVCPSGAIQTDYPSLDVILTSLSELKNQFNSAGGKDPALILFDTSFGAEMISLISRYGNGLPANVIPYEMHSVGRTGHDLLVSSFALGFKKIFIILNPKNSEEYTFLPKQVEIANSLLSGIGNNEKKSISIIEETDPEAVENEIYKTSEYTRIKPSPFIPLGAPRGILRAGIQGLSKSNNNKSSMIQLPEGSPYGKVDVNLESCTICLSCVSACPAGALQDNPDAPQLLFREDACLQCGICVATCPEKAISLVPQFNLDDEAMSAEVIIEDKPFDCIQCGKTFGTTKSIERIIDKLSSHSMFEADGRTEMLKMCEDCRVGAMFAQKDKMLEAKDRPKPRTTDDYLN
jgi:ferredoxin